MFSTLRNRFGIPGVISVIALVFAMFGGAYAASNSSGGGKATASAKAKRGPKGAKGATGPVGPAGPAGPKGDAGAAGAAGSSGTAGTPGAPGASVTVSSVSIPGEEGKCVGVGGAKFAVGTARAYACNGAEGEEGPVGPEGEPWTDGGTLPEGSTEKGDYSLGSETGVGPVFGYALDAISFNIPLKAGGLDAAHAIFVPKLGSNPTCTGSTAAPTAPSGYLCVYEVEKAAMGGCQALSGGLGGGTDSSGAFIACLPEEVGGEKVPAYSLGVWAVTG